MSIRLGSVIIERPVILAPMSGVTDLLFRRLVERLGAGLTVTEMIASREMIARTRESERRRQHDRAGGPLVVQLAGCDPAVMADAARLNQDLGAAIVDINMGCPVKKVVGGQAGSALMRDEAHAARILEATVQAVSIPVTLKMRTGWDSENRNAPRLAWIAEQCGIQLITVHGRTRADRFNGRADWDFIGAVKRAVVIPVVANGDVETPDDALALLRRSGADGLMVGRGACGRPWLLAQIMGLLETGIAGVEPAPEVQRDLVLEHYHEMLSYYGVGRGLRIARKHLGWYLGKAGLGEATRRAVQHQESPTRVRAILRQAYATLAERRAA